MIFSVDNILTMLRSTPHFVLIIGQPIQVLKRNPCGTADNAPMPFAAFPQALTLTDSKVQEQRICADASSKANRKVQSLQAITTLYYYEYHYIMEVDGSKIVLQYQVLVLLTQ